MAKPRSVVACKGDIPLLQPHKPSKLLYAADVRMLKPDEKDVVRHALTKLAHFVEELWFEGEELLMVRFRSDHSSKHRRELGVSRCCGMANSHIRIELSEHRDKQRRLGDEQHETVLPGIPRQRQPRFASSPQGT